MFMTTQAQYEAAVRSLASAKVAPAVLDNILANLALLPPFGIDTPLKLAHFLSQTAHESGGFRIMTENLNYSAQRLRQVWPGRFPNDASAAPYAKNPEALGNLVYANRLGNGDPASGDGYRYRGRGLLQITGKSNYAGVAKLTNLDLTGQPELAESADHCTLIAAATWKYISAASLPETAGVEVYTRKVNGGLVGLADRTALFDRAKLALVPADPGLA